MNPQDIFCLQVHADILGVESGFFHIFKAGFIAGFIRHKPTADIDGPGFLTVTFGDGTEVKPYIFSLGDKHINPDGFPIKSGADNILFFWLPLYGYGMNSELADYYSKLADGDTFTVRV